MSQFALRSSVRARIAVYDAADGLVQFARRATDRARREQTGQDVLEYAGLLVLVALIITAIVALGLQTKIANGISSEVDKVLGAGSSPTPTTPSGGPTTH